MDFTKATGTLTIAPGLTVGVASGDGYAIHRRQRRAAYVRLINQAILDGRREMLLPKFDETVTMQANVYEYNLPTDFWTVKDIYEESGISNGVFDAPIPRNAWDIKRDSTTPQIVFNPQLFTPTAGKALQVRGQVLQAEMALDTDTCRIDPSFILHRAEYYLRVAQSGGNTDEARFNQQQSAVAFQLSEAARQNLTGRVWPDSRLVWT